VEKYRIVTLIFEMIIESRVENSEKNLISSNPIFFYCLTFSISDEDYFDKINTISHEIFKCVYLIKISTLFNIDLRKL